jgi:hypothetical protein
MTGSRWFTGDDGFALVHGLYWLALNLLEERPLLISIGARSAVGR